MPSYPFPSNNDDVICEITGSWPEDIKFNEEVVFSVKESTPPSLSPCDNPIPSDSRYREDKIWLKYSFDNKELGKVFEGYAQSWKLGLEAQQRYERDLRKKYEEKKEKEAKEREKEEKKKEKELKKKEKEEKKREKEKEKEKNKNKDKDKNEDKEKEKKDEDKKEEKKDEDKKEENENK